jgi:hypothetical protein
VKDASLVIGLPHMNMEDVPISNEAVMSQIAPPALTRLFLVGTHWSSPEYSLSICFAAGVPYSSHFAPAMIQEVVATRLPQNAYPVVQKNL